MEMTRGFESLDNCRPEPRRNIGFVGQMNDGGTPDGRLALWRIGNDILCRGAPSAGGTEAALTGISRIST
jgi:hypothetical protein